MCAARRRTSAPCSGIPTEFVEAQEQKMYPVRASSAARRALTLIES
jgi:hypothetical protein